MNKKGIKRLCTLAMVFCTVFSLHSSFQVKAITSDKISINYNVENDTIIKESICCGVDPDVSKNH